MTMTSGIIMAMLTATAVTAGCRRQTQNAAPDYKQALSDSLPATVNRLITSVGENDPSLLASIVSYPLERPYPLADVADSAEMVAYYSTLVDDSLRNVLVKSRPGRWSENGWRGWTLDDGRYVWVDSLVYDIPYVSSLEHEQHKALVKQEMATLPAALAQPGWEPAGAFKASSGEVARLDVKGASSRDDEAAVYRLAVYGNGTDLRGLPTLVLPGTLNTEGTARTRTFTFDDGHGTRALFTPDEPDDDGLPLVILYPDGRQNRLALKKTYWRNLL